MVRGVWLGCALMMMGCTDDVSQVEETAAAETETGADVDADGDGYSSSEDCDDSNAAIHPGAEERCNGVDDDCDAEVDESGAIGESTWHVDVDGDGFGDPDATVSACDQPTNAVDDATDCNDEDPWVYPGAEDSCDGVDSDCDGAIDEDALDGMALTNNVDSSNQLRVIDPATGAATDAESISGIGSAELNTWAVLSGGEVYAYDRRGDRIYQVDHCAGTATPKGATGMSRVCGLAADLNGGLFGLDGDRGQLLRISVTDGSTTVLYTDPSLEGTCGLAFDCRDDMFRIVVKSGGTASLIEVNPAGSIGRIVETDVPFSVVGLEYDPVEDVLYGSTGEGLYRIDKTTGEGTRLGDMSDGNNLAFLPACP